MFDFDGTIADTFELFVASFAKVAPGVAAQDVDIEALRGMSVKEALAELGIKKWQLPKLIVAGRKEMTKDIAGVSVFEGIDEALVTLKKRGATLAVLSSNSTENIQTVLAKHGLERYFDEVVGGVSLVGKPKAIKKLQKQLNAGLADIIYIGDEVRDIESAQKVGVKCAAVTWGFNTQDILQKNSPDWLISSPGQLVKLLD